MTKSVKNCYDLEAWQKAHRLALDIYRLTKNFPRDEKFGLVSQRRQAASSITANIAARFVRYHFRDTVRFYYQA